MSKTLFSSLIISWLLCISTAWGQPNMPTAKKHHMQVGVECVDCHETAEPVDGVEEPKCLGCHESRDAVAGLTAKREPNPHFGHEDGVACNSCHREHEMSVLSCDDCHQWGLTTP